MDLESPIVPGRSCEGCTLCCKVFEIDQVAKPHGVWCQHCAIGSGCKIYAERPQQCQDFYCGYLTNKGLSEEWKPSRSKIVLAAETERYRVVAYVDQQRPNAWRQEPFYSTLKAWAQRVTPHGGNVVVRVGRYAFVVLPDRDVDLGIISDDEVIGTAEIGTPYGRRIEAFKVHKDDPDFRNYMEMRSLQIGR